MISIGAVFGGGELAGSKVDLLIRQISSAMPAGADPEAFELNIIFHIPGSIVKPEHLGIRTGRFSAKNKILMLQAAVPEAMLDSPELKSFLVKSLVDAVSEAKRFLEKKKVQFNEAEYLRQIDAVKVRM